MSSGRLRTAPAGTWPTSGCRTGSRSSCTASRRGFADPAAPTPAPLEPLVGAQIAPLPEGQLGQRDAAEADAFHRQHLQAGGLAQVGDLSGLRAFQRHPQAGFVLPADLDSLRRAAVERYALIQPFEAVRG